MSDKQDSAQSESSSGAGGEGVASGKGPSSRVLLYLGALAVFTLSTLAAFMSPLAPDGADASFPSWRWWVYPLARHPERERTAIIADLNGACIQPVTGDLWVVGTGGLIAVSKDGGETWEKRAAAPAPKSAPAPDTKAPPNNAPAPSTKEAAPKTAPAYVAHGTARPGDTVLVFVEPGGKPETLKTDAKGEWELTLPSRPRSQWIYGRSERGGSIPPQYFKIDVGAQKAMPVSESEFSEWMGRGAKGAGAQGEQRTPDGRGVMRAASYAPQEANAPNPDGNAARQGNVDSGQRAPTGTASPVIESTPNAFELFSVAFLDEKHGCAVGENGVVVITMDGGVTWREYPSPGTLRLSFVGPVADDFVALGRGWIVDIDVSGATPDIGAEDPTGHDPDANYFRVFSPLEGVPQPRVGTGTRGAFGISGATGNRDHLYVAGERGVFGQENVKDWKPDGTIGETFHSVAGLAVDSASSIAIAVGDGGRIATKTYDNYNDARVSVLRTRADSQTKGPTLRAVCIGSPTEAWAVGDRGAAYRTADSGRNWSPQPTRTAYDLLALAKQDARTAFAVGKAGTVLQTSDAGRTWRRLTCDWAAASDALLKAIRTDPNPDPSLKTPEERRTREQAIAKVVLDTGVLTSHRSWRWPAPWYYFTLIAVVLLLAPAVARPPPETDEATLPASIADNLSSDKPIEPGEPDPLKFNALALGLSRFLRNEKTQPPLTLAVTGRWGQGKSSLMNLVRADLHSFGVRAVWFNAWHHQTEESLLAALLYGVKSQAIPPIWKLDGIGFRIRLLWARTKRRAPMALAIALLFALSAGYALKHKEAFNRSVDRVASVFNQGLALVGLSEPTKPGDKGSSTSQAADSKPQEKAGTGEPPSKPWSFVTATFEWLGLSRPNPVVAAPPEPVAPPLPVFLVASLAVIRALYVGLKSFGADPAKLMSTVSENAKIADLRDQASFRDRFAREFRDVTRALHPRDMLVIIDDLDRCKPENVLEMLEAINFLVTSGECFVMLGMDARMVEHFVSLGFERVADSLPSPEDAAANKEPDPSPEARSKRVRDFAREYMEKLVQIRVPVPVASADDAVRVVSTPEPEKREPPTRLRQMRDAVLAFAVKAALPIMIILALVFASVLGAMLPLGREAPPTTVVLQSGQDAASATRPAGQTAGAPTPAPPKPAETVVVMLPQPPAVLVSSSFTRWPMWVLALLLALPVGVAGLLMVLTQPEVVVRDSSAFNTALKLWLPFLYHEGMTTPRAAKRFTNRVRFLAMLQRPQTPYVTRAERLWSWCRRGVGFLFGTSAPAQKPAGTPALADIKEPMLIAWAAIEWGLGPDYLTVTKDTLSARASGAGLKDFREKVLSNEYWTLLDAARNEYVRLVASVTVR